MGAQGGVRVRFMLETSIHNILVKTRLPNVRFAGLWIFCTGRRRPPMTELLVRGVRSRRGSRRLNECFVFGKKHMSRDLRKHKI